MVIWIIGLSGAGKTTLANQVIAQTRKSNSNVVLVDGDVVRKIFGDDLGYTREDRLRNAERVCGLCKFLDDQGIHVVCAILSLFRESRDWNRQNYKSYYEVFIDTPIEELIRRDSKGLYKKFVNNEITDVAGMDIDFPIPKNADLVIHNHGSKADFLKYAETIADKITTSG